MLVEADSEGSAWRIACLDKNNLEKLAKYPLIEDVINEGYTTLKNTSISNV